MGGSIGQTAAAANGRVAEQSAQHLALRAVPQAAVLAREHVRQTLRCWNRDDLVDAAVLIVSELVTNALTHAAPGGMLVGLVAEEGRLTLEVWDQNPVPPTPTMAGPDDEDGRGLLLVRALAARWGFRCPDRGGKTVWAVLEE